MSTLPPGPSTFSGLSFAGLSPGDRAPGSSFARLTGKKPSLDAGPVSPIEQAKLASQETFSSVLSQHVAEGVGSKPLSSLNPAQRLERSRQAAEDFVAVAFVQPILKNLRSGGVAGELPPPFGPGPGEKQFRTIADAQLAKGLTHASRWPLVENLAKRLATPHIDPKSKEAVAAAAALPGSPADLRLRAAAVAAKAAKAAADAASANQSTSTDKAQAKAAPLPANLSYFPSR